MPPAAPLPTRCEPHTPERFRRAAIQRLQDGERLAGGPPENWTAAIYLWGYVVEMLLKAAAVVLAVGAEATECGLEDLKTLAGWAREFGVGWPKKPPLHAVHLWGESVVAFRAGLPGLAYSSQGFADEVLTRSREVNRGWGETLRYHDTMATLSEVWAAYEHAIWFVSHMRSL